MDNYLFFWADKIANLSAGSGERVALEWIAMCQILHHFTNYATPPSNHKHRM